MNSQPSVSKTEVLVDAAGRADVPTAKSHRGRAPKTDALVIAKAAASDYNHLTLKRPDQSKAFIAFLRDVFDALGRTEDSVEGVARKVIEWWESART